MLSTCKPVQVFVNMRIARYGKGEVFPYFVYSNYREPQVFSFLKLLNTFMMVNISKKYMKGILQELGSSIFCFDFVKKTMILTTGGWGN